MNDVGILQFGEDEFPFDAARWSKLPALPGALALDLFHAVMIKDVSLDELTGWDAWWEQSKDPWGPLFLPKEIRKLDKRHRFMAETGLGNRPGLRKMSDPPLADGGVLSRLAGIEWKVGLEDALARLPIATDLDRSKTLLARALLHAIELKKTHSQQVLVEWMHARNLFLGELVDPGAMAKMWLQWSKSSKLSADHPLYAKSLIVRPIQVGGEEENRLWNACVDAPYLSNAHEVIAAWCQLHPSTWERQHRKAREENSSIKPAWLLACRRAQKCGLDDGLWQAAIASPSAQAWMHRLWGDKRSALVDWMSDALIHRQAKGEPGSDPISHSLREMGAPLPGSEEERNMRGVSLASCVDSMHLQVEWVDRHPEWLLPDVGTGRTPLFQASHWADAKRWVALGLSWFHLDALGQSAFGAFLEDYHPSGKGRAMFSEELCQAFADGSVPVVDRGSKTSIAGNIVSRGMPSLSASFLEARLRCLEPPTLLETMDIAHHAGEEMLSAWKNTWTARSMWTVEHDRAMWRGLILHGEACNMRLPAAEDTENPMWLWLLRQSINSKPVESMRLLDAWGLSPIDASHPAWKQDDTLGKAWVALIDYADRDALAGLRMEGADPQWWIDRMENLVYAENQSSMAIGRVLGRFLEVGMPLDEPRVLDALRGFPPNELSRLPPAVASALEGLSMDRATASVPRSSPRSRL